MNEKKMGIGMLFNLIGALLAYLIGSGFASGQEVMQFFSGWGSVGATLLIGALTCILMYFTYTSYAYVGRTRGIADVNGVFEFYSGKIIGRIFIAFVWFYNFGCFFFMVSGFANTLNQQWGLPIYIGGAIAVIISVGTAVLGLKRMVDIIGKVGPVVVGFALILGVISAFKYYPLIAEGNAAINSGEVQVMRAGASPLLAGLSYAGTCVLLVSAYVGRLGNDLRDYKFKYNKIVIGVVAFIYPLCCVLLGLNYIGIIQNASSSAIPNLLLANSIIPFVGSVFAIIILASIYSTMCPIIWTCVSMIIKDEKSLKYKLACVVGGVVTYIVTFFVPYQTLLNKIMTYGGYCGAITCVVCTVGYFVAKAKDKNNKEKIAV
ncbi:MAG TPA: hypothetical protein GX523_14810 [Desulfitobacterium dehalogenans]|uniref:Amino acid permease n=1 Tax=Desulfitobacterium dehalogenans TaxID=36854 RepID=A0A7C6Z637_9FIRM|nr:hypothetical protein [Desulfitobacterium dehalogenans]